MKQIMQIFLKGKSATLRDVEITGDKSSLHQEIHYTWVGVWLLINSDNSRHYL